MRFDQLFPDIDGSSTAAAKAASGGMRVLYGDRLNSGVMRDYNCLARGLHPAESDVRATMHVHHRRSKWSDVESNTRWLANTNILLQPLLFRAIQKRFEHVGQQRLLTPIRRSKAEPHDDEIQRGDYVASRGGVAPERERVTRR
jgi:hypothetical protein